MQQLKTVFHHKHTSTHKHMHAEQSDSYYISFN